MITWLALATLVTTSAPPSQAVGAPPDPPTSVPAAVETSLKRALAGTDNADKAVTRLEPGPLGLTFATVSIPDAYPGTGVVRAILRGSDCYGVHCGRPLSELARKAGWFTTPPPAVELVKVVNAAKFEGLVAVEPGSERVAPKNGGLLVTFVKQDPFNPSARKNVLVAIPAAGADVVTEIALPKPAK
jgi:hypothetical protein